MPLDNYAHVLAATRLEEVQPARARSLPSSIRVSKSDHEFLAGKVIAEACFSNANGGGSGVTLCPNGTSTQSGTGAASPDGAACVSGGTNLCDHGTHVAGIAAGLNTNQQGGEPPNGVAKSASIWAIQVVGNIGTEWDSCYGQSLGGLARVSRN
jgi:hypothetical protein